MIDKRLIKECLKHNRLAQRQVYDELFPKIYHTCKRYIDNDSDIEDTMSDIFVSIFTHIDQLKAPEAIVSWSKKIAVNKCLLYLRKKKMQYDDLDTWEQIADNTPVQQQNDDLPRLINQLPRSSRLVFNLSVIEGYTHKEISQLLDISEGTSKSQLSYAKNKLRTWLERVQPSI